jgi:NhaC family Na+:H+ antiporter
MRSEYLRRKLPLVRAANHTEASATLSSALIPWSDNGVFVFAVLGVSVIDYAPFLFFTYLSWARMMINGWYLDRKS